jgi:hypothetical protein
MIFVASGGIHISGLGVLHLGIFFRTILHIHFNENSLGVVFELYGFGDDICGLVLGLHTHKEEKNILI